ncbi:MAG: hypothetical protein K2X81_11145, partial [Candidatus Obscuribacterales bacterium]|nr:hypothetical protein [Candidatus Obscuribacterales bacterium]
MLFKNEKVNVFGIRHHGPGSARSLLKSLQHLQPDCILVEGPPDANHILPHILSEQMQPPVALLLYAQDDIRRAVYYPFAVFSPEWQALKYGLENGLPVRFMDLPLCHRLAIERAKYEAEIAATAKKGEEESADAEEFLVVDADNPNAQDTEIGEEFNIRLDPLSWLAKAAGYDDSERWWENLVEHRREDLDVFAAIREAMATLRSELSDEEMYSSEFEVMREAHMRQTIRAAIKEGFQRIAVVCGAWHAPALTHLPAAKEDQAILKGLPKLKIEATWIPWTHRRLAMSSGYGAGVRSPGWYHHLWTCDDLVVERWLATVARLLRQKDLDASSAHIIESVRLAEALASMRGQPLPGLEEINEATQAVLCFGNPVPLKLIQDQLVVGDLM